MLVRSRYVASIAIALLLVACATAPPAVDPQVRAALAPTGKLRVGLYPGSPTSYIPGGEPRGVGYEMGRELAARLGVPFEPAIYPGNGPLLEAVKAGQVDVILTNATDERRRFIDFTEPVLEIEKGFLVPAGSRIADTAAVDAAGVRVGVSQGSSSSTELTRELRNAKVVVVPTVKDGSRMLSEGGLEAFGTNKAILYEMGDGLPGSRVLPGRWGLESLALGTPKGRDAALPYLQSFVRSVRAQGLVAQASKRAGLRGTTDDAVK